MGKRCKDSDDRKKSGVSLCICACVRVNIVCTCARFFVAKKSFLQTAVEL